NIDNDRKPYVLLTDMVDGTWVNNMDKGVEKVYLNYDRKNPGILEIYLLSYERIIPVWMARVSLPAGLRNKARLRKLLGRD
ncbi:MAG: hypothetical protein AAF570_23770, partial [Bacteroidota bacterium]